MNAMILTTNEPSAATIIAIGLIFAARPTTRMLIPKNTVTTPTPMSDAVGTLGPAETAQMTTATAATTLVSASDHRTRGRSTSSSTVLPED